MAKYCQAGSSLHDRSSSRRGSGRDNNLPDWRPACLSFLVVAAAALAMLASTPATAQSTDSFIFKPAEPTWREYRRDDHGFRVELPGEPKVYSDPDPAPFIKQTLVELPFDEITFSVTIKEHDRTLTPAQENALLDRLGAIVQRTSGATSVTRFTMNGYPGRQDVDEKKDDFRGVYRHVAMGKRVIQLTVAWHPGVETNAAAQRFLGSFTLLPGAR